MRDVWRVRDGVTQDRHPPRELPTSGQSTRIVSTATSVTSVHAIHSDHLNTPRALSNPQLQVGQPSGTVVWRWCLNQASETGSNAFGAQRDDKDPDGNSVTVNFRLRFPGQLYDDATGLHHNYFRDYEPGTGRCVESDPIGLEGGLSSFGYGSQSPLRFIDHLGLSATCGEKCDHKSPGPCAKACPDFYDCLDCWKRHIDHCKKSRLACLAGFAAAPQAKHRKTFVLVYALALRQRRERKTYDAVIRPIVNRCTCGLRVINRMSHRPHCTERRAAVHAGEYSQRTFKNRE